MVRLDKTIPIRTVSEANSSEHWTDKHARHKKQKAAIKLFFRGVEIAPPAHIKLTRIAPRTLDDDNLQMSMKSIRDYIADIILPGYKMGRADSVANAEGVFALSWEYAQEKGKPKEYGVRVEIT